MWHHAAMSARLSTPPRWILLKTRYKKKTSYPCRITCERSGSERDRRIALYKSGQQQQQQQQQPRESRRDQEEGGELDSQEEVRLSFAGPGEIKRREVVLDLQDSPEEIKRREADLGSESWTCLLLQLFLNSSATDIVLVTLLRTAVETAIAEHTSCFALVRSPLP